MLRRTIPVSVILLATLATLVRGQDDATRPDATMLRYPDVSATHIVFVYANDIWTVPREGGMASPLASPPGTESFPRFSPDGKTIAFSGNYDGNIDVYTLATAGGVPFRVTYHPSREWPCGWTPDGKLLFTTGAFTDLGRQMALATVPATGGLPARLPLPYGMFGEISPDGKWLAYTPDTRDFSTWKRYCGGLASDIWLFNLQDHSARRITEWEGTDSQPMWHGRDIYYMSDAGAAHRLNIWKWDAATGSHEQVTTFTDYDIKWPSIGPGSNGQGEIVFQNGPYLYLLDLATHKSQRVDVIVPGARPKLRPQEVDEAENVESGAISATGKRAVFGARGDLWTAPAQDGSARALTRTSGAHEREPAWSPDGQWIACFSDASGEYRLYIMQSDGRGETKQLTADLPNFPYDPTWSPDSKLIAYNNNAGKVHLLTVETGETKLVDTDPYADRHRVSFSPDSRWLAYLKQADNQLATIWLYDIESDERHQVTGGMFNDSWPTFDREGKYLYFASNREFNTPTYADLDNTFVYADTDVLMMAPLRAEVGSPFAPKSDEETWGEEAETKDSGTNGVDKSDENDNGNDNASEDDSTEKKEERGETKDEDKESKKAKKVEPVVIEIEGLEQRAVQVPVDSGRFFNICVNHKGQLIYARSTPRGTRGKPSIKLFDPAAKEDKRKENTVVEDTGSFDMSADGKKLLIHKNGTWAIVDAAADQKLDKPMTVKNYYATVEPRTEWRQMFDEAWRIERDFFYDPNMHGVDWGAVRARYGQMVNDCMSRSDLNFVIGEMISELNVGHAYLWQQGDVEEPPKMSVGMLGIDFALQNGAYRIARLAEGGPWDVDARNPLQEPGVDVKAGEYLLAVNGTHVDVTKAPWAAFLGLAGKTITLTVSEKPELDDSARHVVVKALANDGDLRYRRWVERNRAYVAERTDGRVGYIHVPNTGRDGQNELFRQFFGQTDRAALIIDERWNGGGQIPTRFIELLDRPVRNYWAMRHGRDTASPRGANFGPKCMLINGEAGSGGDLFPYYFREYGLGKLIGMRTWGGLVGISGNPGLMDGGRVTAPAFAFYELDGTWGIEGHGVDPDIKVVDDPSKMVVDPDPMAPDVVHDPQLDAAIDHMLAEIEKHPYKPVPHPPYPDRSGMGVTDTER